MYSTKNELALCLAIAHCYEGQKNILNHENDCYFTLSKSNMNAQTFTYDLFGPT